MLNLIEFIDDFFTKNDILLDNDNNVYSIITIDSQDIIDILEKLEDNSVLFKCMNGNTEIMNISKLSIGMKITVYLALTYLRSSCKYYYFENFDKFLDENRTFLFTENYFINDLKYSSISKVEECDLIKVYNKLLILINIISLISIDKNQESSADYKYTIFDKRKIILHSIYNTESLQKISKVEKLDKIISTLSDEIIIDSNKRINKIFLINAIEDVLPKENRNIDLKDFLINLNKIYNEYQVHHRAYINSLEPTKLKNEAAKDLKESFSKLNTLLGDINSKIIFLPIAFIVSLGQMNNDSQIKNIAIFMGMTIFCMIVYKFSSIQQTILTIIKDEIEVKEKECKEVDNIFESVSSILIRLNNLLNEIRSRVIWTIRLNWIILVIVFLSTLYYSDINWGKYISINGKAITKIEEKN